MAKKKSSSQKTSSSSKPSSSDSKPKGPTYEQVLGARREMEAAHQFVRTASNRLRAARTDLSDFKIRDRKVAEQEKALQEARQKAAAATERFNELKYQGN